MRTFKLLNVFKIVDTESKANRLEMLGYEEVKEDAPVIEEVTIEEVVTEEVKTEDEPEEVVTEEVIEEDQPEPKKKASARKTTKEG